MEKRAALELSVSTIIVIVIGVALLSLGLMWVRGTFSKIDFLTTDAFEKADAELGRVTNIDQALTVAPKNIEIEKGGASKDITLIIANFEEGNIDVQATISSTNPKVVCLFADTKDKTSKQYSLPSGEQASITILIDEKGGTLGTEICNIEVSGIPGDNREELIVNVIKK